MKIFMHEFITGGGPGSSTIAPTLLAEGRMMLEALLNDLLRLQEHQFLLLIDRDRVEGMSSHPRLSIEEVRGNYDRLFEEMVEIADAALLIAPETGGLLEGLTAIVERNGKLLLGSSSAGIKATGNKAFAYRLLKKSGIPTPETHVIRHSDDLAPLARHLGYPVVVKPLDGAGCENVYVARQETELRRVVAAAGRGTGREDHLLQPYVRGIHASVSLLTDGVRCLPLTLNLQKISGRMRLRYLGGRVPLDHPLRSLAFRRAEEVVGAVAGLRGYVGIDMILTDREAVVIEVNPRITTSYVGIRKVLRQNLGAMMLETAIGNLPGPGQLEIIGTARFSCGLREGMDRRSARWPA